MDQKRCPRCKQTKPTSEFGKDRRNKDGLNLYCRSCKKQYNDEQKSYRLTYYKNYHQAHREEEREYSSAYRKNHPENCRKLCANYRAAVNKNKGTISTVDMICCLEFFHYECAYSGVPLTDGYHLDHITPVSKRGENNIHNIVPCLPIINLQKATRDFETWYPQQSFYSEERYNKILEWIKKREG